MLVANTFDLWKKDSFFSAAEEVQESADIMESAFRIWDRERRKGLRAEDLDELCRELQTALGTAKWQLEEFERAVRLSYRNRADNFTTARHGQFVAAIEGQISHVEAALREFFNKEARQPLRWVSLNEEECDDLAVFLRGTPGTSQTMQDGCAKPGNSAASSLQETQFVTKTAITQFKAAHSSIFSNQTTSFNEIVPGDKSEEQVMKLKLKKVPQTKDDVTCQAERTTGTRRTCSSPDIKIVIANEDEDRKGLLPSIEATPKEKGSKLVFSKQRYGDHVLPKIWGQVGARQRPLHGPLLLRSGCSVQLTLALLVAVLLVVPFLLYST